MSRGWRLALLVGLLLLGFGLRLHQLDAQSMWSDEGLSLYRARQSVADLLAGTIVIDGQASQDTNPPLYFLLLSGLRALAGESVFALRYLGVLTAVLSFPLLYKLGKRLGSWQVGLGALFWLAISPLHVWQSQDMRNYTLLLFWNLASVYALSQIVLPARPQPDRTLAKWGVLWAVAALAGIYTHYFGLFGLAFGALALLVWGVRRWQGWPPPRWLVGTTVLVGMVSLPVVWLALSRFQGSPQVDFVFVAPHHFLSHVLSAFSVGVAPGVVQPWWRVLPVVLLAVWGGIRLWHSGRRAAALFLLGYWFVPLFLLELLSYFNPLYNGVRHLIMSLPPFLLLLGAATAVSPSSKTKRNQIILSRLVPLLLALAVVASQGQWLYQQFTAPALVKDDIQGMAAYLTEVAQPEDVIVLHDTIIGFVFDYYYEGSAPWTAVPAWGQNNRDAVLQTLQAAAENKQRVWFVDEPSPRIGFPASVLPEWMDANWVPIARERFAWLWLATAVRGYAVAPIVAELPPEAASMHVTWANDLTLVGAEWPAAAQAGSFWQPRLYWSSPQPAPPDVSLSVRLVDEAGQVWHQADEPLWPTLPPAQWQANALVRVQPLIALPAGIPPGSYRVLLRVTDNVNFQTIATQSDEIDIVAIAQLPVAAATAPDDLADLPEHTAQSVRLNRAIELLGVNLPTDQYRPGHLVPFTLYWRVWQTPTEDYQLEVEMVDEASGNTQTVTVAPTRPDYPTSAWQPGDILQSQVAIPLPGRAEANQTIRVTLVDGTGKPVHSLIKLGSITVEPWPLSTELPAVATPVQATFGDDPFAVLAGYDLSAETAVAGDTLSLTLVWRTETPLNQNLIVFVHLADEAENLVGQGDGIPVNGLRLTDSWRQGEVLVDTHQITIGPATAVGRYKLWVGFYDPETNERLPVRLNGDGQPDGRLLLTEVEIE